MTTLTPLETLRSAKKLGILFSGGGARASFQVGVIETLYELGIEPKVCLGVSIGAWNASAVAVGNWRRLRHYWRFFCRMRAVDFMNLFREHSPFRWSHIHLRAYNRYVTSERIRSGLPLYIGLTKLSDRTTVVVDAKTASDPFKLLLASNYLWPFYTHPPVIDGQKYGDGGYTNNIPYEALFEAGCDAVVIMAAKGESEGGLYRSPEDYDHEIPPAYRDRVVVIRPRHRMPLGFSDRRWSRLHPIIELGRLRTREILLGERHPECDVRAPGTAITLAVLRLRKVFKRSARAPLPQESARS